MFGLTTTRRLRQETDALRAETGRLRRERDEALEERGAFKAAAKSAATKFCEADDRQRLIDGGRLGRPVPPTVAELRERDRARALEQRLTELQAVTERCTCGGGA